MLVSRDSPPFSDGEDNLAYLSALAVRDEDRGDTSLSPDMYVHGGLQGAKLDGAELDEQESSELTHRRARQQQTKDAGRSCQGRGLIGDQ